VNPDVELLHTQVLSDDWYTLRKLTFRYRGPDGRWSTQSREAYDRGNGAALLLYHPSRNTVVLTRQFRMPTYVNGNPDGRLVEVCAGLLDGEDPETAIRREAEEETGFRVGEVTKVYEAYMSPGSVTEVLHLFTAPYSDADKVSSGGGTGEEERIEVLELPFAEALTWMAEGRIRDAKTMLLLQHAALTGLLNPRAGSGSIPDWDT
jgi:nudix-type nucleoside diphosphatase (YffH/AdpP family)